jgi:hypothetical protein
MPLSNLSATITLAPMAAWSVLPLSALVMVTVA